MQWGVDPGLIDDAKIEAKRMQETGEIIRPVPFGGGRLDIIFVSTDQTLVIGTDSFDFDDKTFYVGSKK